MSTGLTVNASKTEAIVFTRRYKVDDRGRPLTMFGTELKEASEVKYLGVILDSKLSWAAHIDRVYKKFTTSLWLCKRAVGPKWGLTPKAMLWILEAVLLPRLTYGAVVWWRVTNKKTVVAKLKRLRGLALRAISSATKTTPTMALGVIMNVAPFDLTIRAEAVKTAFRLTSSGGWKSEPIPVCQQFFAGRMVWECRIRHHNARSSIRSTGSASAAKPSAPLVVTSSFRATGTSGTLMEPKVATLWVWESITGEAVLTDSYRLAVIPLFSKRR